MVRRMRCGRYRYQWHGTGGGEAQEDRLLIDGPVTEEEVNGFLREAGEGELKGILGYKERPLVSVDYKDGPRSPIIDAPSTRVVDGTQVKILAWYDNEWDYVNRMMELARKVAVSL